MDPKLLRDSFAAVAPQADEFTRYFYGHLFARGGQAVIDIFPPDMSYVREHLGAAIGKVVELAEDPGQLAPVLMNLGRAHRKHGIGPQHFDLVAGSLLAALARYDPAWTPEAASSWTEAYILVSRLMQEGMAQDAQAGNPPWWDGVITFKENRTYDIVILSVRLSQPMTWAPGQSVAVQFEGGPNIWRNLTPANAPRASRIMDFHVRIVPGGLMSVPLALHADPGKRMKIAPAPSTLRLDEPPERDIVMIAGSTGLTPMLAMLDRLSATSTPPDVRLFFGAREPDGLYELERLTKLAHEHDWLTVIHAVTAPPEETNGYEGEHGTIVDVATAGPSWNDRDAYVCGPSKMVQAAAGRLVALGMPGSQLHVENFGREG